MILEVMNGARIITDQFYSPRNIRELLLIVRPRQLGLIWVKVMVERIVDYTGINNPRRTESYDL